MRTGLWIAFFPLICFGQITPNQKVRPSGKLLLQQSIEREIAAGFTDQFTVDVEAGQFSRVVVHQIDTDVSVRIAGPDGKVIVTADSPNEDTGPEPASWISDRSGTYEVRVAVADGPAKTGKYRIELTDKRTAGGTDPTRIDAERTLFNAVALSQVQTRESRAKAFDAYERAASLWQSLKDTYEEALCRNQVGELQAAMGDKRKALTHFSESLSLWKTLGDKPGEISALNNLGLAHDDLGEKPKALEYFEQALTLVRERADRSGEATLLSNIGRVYVALGDKGKALDYLNRALPLRRAIGDQRGEAFTLNHIGTVQYARGEMPAALDSFKLALRLRQTLRDQRGQIAVLNNLASVYAAIGDRVKAREHFLQTLPLAQSVGDRALEASVLNNIGAAVNNLGEVGPALEYFEKALNLWRGLEDRSGEAATLNNIGNLYFFAGDRRKSLDYFARAASLLNAIGDRPSEAATLTRAGTAYNELGEKQKALEYFAKALPVVRELGDRPVEANTLNSIGLVYSSLGEYEKALENFARSLPLRRAVQDRQGEAYTLNGMGQAYVRLGKPKPALDCYRKALPLARTIRDRTIESWTLNNIGSVLETQGQKQKALEHYELALKLSLAVEDRPGQALALNNLGSVHERLGNRPKALEYFSSALPLHRAVEDRSGEASTLQRISQIYQKASPDLAIALGKQAVNVLQTIRHDNKSLEDSLRKSFERSIEAAYRYVAGLLVDQQRFPEAEEILNLLKDREAADFIRRDSMVEQLRSATLLEKEKEALARYEQILGQVVTLGKEKSDLVAKSAKESLNQQESLRSTEVDRDLKAANTVLNRYFLDLERSFAPDSAYAERVKQIRDAENLQDTLQELGPDVVAIYTLMLQDRYTALLITSGTRKSYTTRIAQADLNRKIFAFRQRLDKPTSNPLPLAQELYRILFPEDLRADLDKAGAKTIMWSLDGTIRYIPIAALHDGKQYLVTRFRNSLITPVRDSLTKSSRDLWKGVGFGVSKQVGEFTALPSVPEELRSIFRQGGGNEPVPGSVRLDPDFTRESFEAAMRQPNKSVVHIATHFDSQPGVVDNSRLLLGDGTSLSLGEIAASPRLFSGVELLTLSACRTAFTNRSEDGREIDSFGTIAQRLGARAVVASLWSVNDQATARLMEAMYRSRQEHPELGKNEALRQAQERMLTGAIRSEAGREGAHDWTHPFFWAPFILIGNWK